jgi:hypothetical protein
MSASVIGRPPSRARDARIALLEVPALAVELHGDVLGEVLFDYPKYPQMLLAANVAAGSRAARVAVELVDMKMTRPHETQCYRAIAYEGETLGCYRIGAPFAAVEEPLAAADIIGISANYTFERPVVAWAIEQVRRLPCRPLVVVGGHDATVDPGYYLRRGADLCVLGEGEATLLDILDGWHRDALERLSGIAFLEGAQVRRSGSRRRHDLMAITFPSATLLRSRTYSQCPDGSMPDGVSPNLAVFETSRGCGEGCSFCDSTYVVGAYRSLPLERLLERIEVLDEAGIRTILFADDNLLYRMLPSFDGASGRRDLLVFFRALAARGFAWTFYNGVQFGLLEREGQLDEELIDALFAQRLVSGHLHGCFRAYVPLEKFDGDEMKRLPKLRPIEVEQAIVAAIAARQVPELNLGFIIGSPRETPRTLLSAERTVKKFGEVVRQASGGRSLPRFFPWCSVPVPGTPDHKFFGPNVRYSATDYPELFSCYTSVVANECFSPLGFTLARRRMDHELNLGGKAPHSVALPVGEAR